MSVELKFLELIQTLTNTKGKGSAAIKADLLAAAKADPEMNDYAQYMLPAILDSRTNLYQTDVDPSLIKGLKLKGIKKGTLREAINTVLGATNSERRGDKGARLLAKAYHATPTELQPLFESFVQRKLVCGVGVKKFNEVWPEMIYHSGYMRCKSYKLKLVEKWPWARGIIAQLKSDGMFANCFVTVNGNDIDVGFKSRTGKKIDTPAIDSLKMAVATAFGNYTTDDDDVISKVIHGELLIRNAQGVILSREKSNGMLNGLIQTGEELPEGFTVLYRAWDIINYEEYRLRSDCDTEYEQRLNLIDSIISTLGESAREVFDLTEMKMVYSLQEMVDYFQELAKRGEEGLVIKTPEMLWMDGDSSGQIKVKLVVESEMRVVGFKQGEPNSKYADTLGSLLVSSQDGLVVTGCAGLTDKDRDYIWNNKDKVEGAIFGVKHNGIQYNYDEEGELKPPHALYHPRSTGERLDKAVADTLDKIREDQESALDIKGEINV